MPKHFTPSDPPPHSASDAIPHVPGKLLDDLHQANKEFSTAKEEREEAVDASDSDTPRESAKAHVREAEKEVEDVTKKIDRIIHRDKETGSSS